MQETPIGENRPSRKSAETRVTGALEKEERGARAFAGAVLGELGFVIAPRAFSLLAALCGLGVLAALTIPNTLARVSGDQPPLGVLEASHFLSSIAATALIILSVGLRQRLTGAWAAAVIAFALGAVLTFGAGRHWMLTALLALAALGLFASRHAFYRKGSIARAAISAEAAVLAIVAIAATEWLGFFAYRNVDYSHDLWWTFALDADASRFLRTLVVVCVMVVLFALWRIMQPGYAERPQQRTPEIDARLEAIVSSPGNARADAALAFLPDKSFRISQAGDAFAMFGVRGRNWICVGEPVGPPAAQRELAFALKRETDSVRANLIFYGVRDDFLPVVLDAGLWAQKIGETALIDLPAFSLEGPSRARLRQAMSRLKRDGGEFGIIPREAFEAHADELRVVSDEWLAAHVGSEKRFTLGRFDPQYLRRFSTAVIRREGRIEAFANLWMSGDGAVLAIDLMRHRTDTPNGVMDCLFVHIAQWGRDNGFRELDLGMAPLSGLAANREADVLSRIGALVYAYGEEVYGFEGLRNYKEKFKPRWEPVYLAGPGRVSLAAALLDVAMLTSGGIRGLLRGMF